MKELTAIVLAGGLGTRLKAVSGDIPKVLVPISQTPFLKILVDQLMSAGVSRVVFSLNYKAEEIKQAILSWKLPIKTDFIVENERLDTGGAVKYCVKKLDLSGFVLVTNGDSFIESGVNCFVNDVVLSCSDSLSSIALLTVDNASRYGKIEMDPKTKIVLAFNEKDSCSHSNLIYGGLAYLDADEIKKEEQKIFSIERYYFTQLIQKKSLKGALLEGWFCDIGIPEDYKKFCEWYSQR